jgi:ornithine carbamoyltransferase
MHKEIYKNMGKDLLSITDYKSEELLDLVKFTDEVKRSPEKFKKALVDKKIVMIFEKPSTRTRVSFEAAILELGGHAINITRNTSQLDRGETPSDSAKALERYVDAIVARVDKHETLLEMAKSARVPVINALSDLEHPCQIISDLYTIYERSGTLAGIKIAYVGDANNVCNSLMLGCALTGISLSVATPREYAPKKAIIEKSQALARKTGAKIEVTEDPFKAAENADYIYTDVWISMGQEDEKKNNTKVFQAYQINDKLLSKAKKGAYVMHCLPAHRGMEIAGEVMDGPRSIVWDQAENRLHAQKAILLKLLKN